MKINKITKLLAELESEIKKQNLVQRCSNYFKDCVQCKFWKKFDSLVKELSELIEPTLFSKKEKRR